MLQVMLHGKIDPAGSSWSMLEKKTVLVNMKKANKGTAWDRVVVTFEKIDAKNKQQEEQQEEEEKSPDGSGIDAGEYAPGCECTGDLSGMNNASILEYA